LIIIIVTVTLPCRTASRSGRYYREEAIVGIVEIAIRVGVY
jgi:hypothetical protein